MHFTTLESLRNESDVEQKLMFPLLTALHPDGLGYSKGEVFTKSNLKHLVIEKGKNESDKVYRPDYVVLLLGLPVLIVEVKAPGLDLVKALREARLYAAELNSFYSAGVNPCMRIVVCNGNKLMSSPADSATVDFDISFSELTPAVAKFHQLIDLVGRKALLPHAERMRPRVRDRHYLRPVNELGGQSIRNEEIGYNQFGAKLALDFLHLFNPQTREEQLHIVRNAYVRSRRREHYADEIDKVVRASLPPGRAKGLLIEDSRKPAELIRAFQKGLQLQHKLFLLVGAVGSGKSTFVTYFRDSRLPQDVEDQTVWVKIDLNKCPNSEPQLSEWIVRQLIQGLRRSSPTIDFDELETQLKVFSVEVNALKKGVLSLFPEDSDRYREALYSAITDITKEPIKVARCLARYLCSERRKLLVFVLDNCDKGDPQEQLAVFQSAVWIQSEIPCLTFLPIRDVTYDLYRNRPPLDTAIKDFVFRVETPPFTEVLRQRLTLAMAELTATNTAQQYDYTLDNGMRVVFPATEIGIYLGCLFRSLYEHDQLLKKMIIGLAGKNIRNAIEIFLDFCRSGHIGEKEFLKMRTSRGNYPLPFSTVMRVLLRVNRRFYDGNSAHVRNLFQCEPSDLVPNNFLRFAILEHCRNLYRLKGPSGVKGFHRGCDIIAAISPYGFDSIAIEREVLFLVESRCLVAEHERIDQFSPNDLIAISPTGFAHLQICRYIDYLAACSEDAFVDDPEMARRIASRIGSSGPKNHYRPSTLLANAEDFLNYLATSGRAFMTDPHAYMYTDELGIDNYIENVATRIENRRRTDIQEDDWPEVDSRFKLNKAYSGEITGVTHFGVFVRLGPGITGLLHISMIPSDVTLNSFTVGDTLQVMIIQKDSKRRRLKLKLAD